MSREGVGILHAAPPMTIHHDDGGVRRMMVRERADLLAAVRHELLEREARIKSLVDWLLDHDPRRETSAGTARQAPTARSGDHVRLTERQLQILRLLVAGRSNRQIGAQLRLNAGTIRNHVSRIFLALGVTTRTQAAVRAVELGLSRAGPAEASWHVYSLTR
jgi:DNA-binding NarL/FixJ family response regulator